MMGSDFNSTFFGLHQTCHLDPKNRKPDSFQLSPQFKNFTTFNLSDLKDKHRFDNYENEKQSFQFRVKAYHTNEDVVDEWRTSTIQRAVAPPGEGHFLDLKQSATLHFMVYQYGHSDCPFPSTRVFSFLLLHCVGFKRETYYCVVTASWGGLGSSGFMEPCNLNCWVRNDSAGKKLLTTFIFIDQFKAAKIPKNKSIF